LAEPAGPAEPADLAEPAGLAEPADLSEPAGPAEPAGLAEPAGPAGSVGPVQVVDGLQSPEPGESSEQVAAEAVGAQRAAGGPQAADGPQAEAVYGPDPVEAAEPAGPAGAEAAGAEAECRAGAAQEAEPVEAQEAEPVEALRPAGAVPDGGGQTSPSGSAPLDGDNAGALPATGTSDEEPSVGEPVSAGMPSGNGMAPAQSPLHADDLRQVIGIGPVIQRVLLGAGITTYRQLARLGDDGDVLGRAGEALGGDIRARVERQRWVEQARELHFRKYGERL
jgi:predicted flap endonuclease-1-like 5' DNA nuclease